MKKSIMSFAVAIAAAAALMACGGQAQAAPTSVNNATGTVVYGTDALISVEKDTSSGNNRVKARYAGGVQYVEDDRGWSRYAALRAGMNKVVDAPVSTTGLAYDVTKTNGITCQSGGTSVFGIPNSPSDYLADGCQFFNAAKGASN